MQRSGSADQQLAPIRSDFTLSTLPLSILPLSCSDNIRLDNEDQIFAVCKEDESLVVITGEGTGTEVGPGDMINQYYLQELIGEGTYGRGESKSARLKSASATAFLSLPASRFSLLFALSLECTAPTI